MDKKTFDKAAAKIADDVKKGALKGFPKPIPTKKSVGGSKPKA